MAGQTHGHLRENPAGYKSHFGVVECRLCIEESNRRQDQRSDKQGTVSTKGAK